MSVTKTPVSKDISGYDVQHWYASAASDMVIISGNQFVKPNFSSANAFFQSNVAVSLSFTLSPTADAMNSDPLIQANVLWGTPVVLAANVITNVGKPFTAVKAVWPAAGELHMTLG